MNTKRFAVLLCMAVTALALGACDQNPPPAAGGDKVLRFSAIPDQNATALKEKYDPVAAYLSDKLGVEVEYVPAKDYAASVELFRNGDIQLAWFGGLTGAQARHAVDGARAIAQGEADPAYYSYFIAHADTGLSRNEQFPMELGELTFTFGSESSTSGRLMPEHFIRQNTGKSPRSFFQTAPTFSGAHDKTVELVEAGQVQAGAVNYKVYDQRVQDGRTDPNVCRIVWLTPKYADYNFTAHPKLNEMFGEGFIDKLQATLLAIEDESIMSAFLRKRFIAAKNDDFAGIVAVAEELGFLD